MQKGLETRVKDQKSTTSEDYLDSFLNSIMGNKVTSSNTDDLGLFSDVKDEIDTEKIDEEDFFNTLEDELFGSIEDTGAKLVDDDDYFEKEITDAELFDIDDDIMSIIDESPVIKEDSPKIHEIIKDDNIEEKEEKVENVADEVNDAIEANDSAVDDNLQGLLDVMGIDEGASVENFEEPPVPEKKEKKKLFGKNKKDKKSKKAKKVEAHSEDGVSVGDMLDFSSLSDMMGASDDLNTSEHTFGHDTYSESNNDLGLDNELDFSNMDFSATEESHNVMDDPFGDLDFNLDAKTDEGSSSLGNFTLDDEDSEQEDNKTKKEKKEKKKKEKKPKQKKVKKNTNKAKKVKTKPVKAKQPDEIIRISKGFVILSFSFIFVFVFAVIFGGDYYTYNKKISKATKEYVNKNYTAAYDEVFGLEMKKDDDKELFNQIQTVMFVNRHYEAYENLIRMDEYEQALYSLLKGVKMFDKYQNQGRKLNCYDDMQNVLGWIDRGLLETFGLTESEARELNLINNDEKVGYEVAVIAKAAREKAEAEAKALEEAAKEAEKLENQNEKETE